MITLLTAVPGAGKTSNLFNIICGDSSYNSRLKFYHNIYLLILDLNICYSFAGFIADRASSLKGEERHALLEQISLIKRQGRLPIEEDFPGLVSEFHSTYSPQRTFHKWVKKLYPKKQVKRLEAVIKNVGWEFELEHIKHLNLHWIQLPDPYKWFELPDKAVIVKDECQTYYPLRSSGSRVPEHVARYETHRHTSHDVFLITQDAGFIDSHLRKLVGRHWYIGQTKLGDYLYSRDGGIITQNSRGVAQAFHRHKRITKKPKNVYGVYFSSPENFHSRKLDTIFIGKCAAVLGVMAILSSYVYEMVNPDLSPEQPSAQPVASSPAAGAASEPESASLSDSDGFSVSKLLPGRKGSLVGGGRSKSQFSIESVDDFQQQFTPVIPDMPWSAPIYQPLLEVRSFPKPVCIRIDRYPESECRCFTQQATPLQISERGCNSYVDYGWFDFTQEGDSGPIRGRISPHMGGGAARVTSPVARDKS